MTRIVGGRWGGRRLITPAGAVTRPTAEKVRAALASSLTAAGGLVGARVLDLYAGSGALGLELVSRGAAAAVFVERDRAALAALRANLAALADGQGAQPDVGPELLVVPGDVAAFAGRAPAGSFDVVVADPPYDLAESAVFDVLADLHRAGLLIGQADLVVERSARTGEPNWPAPLEGVRARRYGDSLLCYGRAP